MGSINCQNDWKEVAVCASVCMCVCVRERVRVGEGVGRKWEEIRRKMIKHCYLEGMGSIAWGGGGGERSVRKRNEREGER